MIIINPDPLVLYITYINWIKQLMLMFGQLENIFIRSSILRYIGSYLYILSFEIFFTWLWVLSTWFKHLIFISFTFYFQSSCLAPSSFNMPILCSRVVCSRVQVLLPMATFQKQVMLNTVCIVFPLVGTQSSIEDGTLWENVSQLEAFNYSTTP